MTLNRTYRKTPRASPSYDYLDFIAGLGYRTMYAGAVEHAAGFVYFLTNQTIASSFDIRSTTCSGPQNTQTEINFDQAFQVTARVRGDALVNYTIRYADLNSASNTKFTVYLVRDGVETSIGTITSGTDDPLGAGGPVWRRNAVKISLADTTFFQGDTLRLEVITTVTDAAASNVIIYHDPASITTFTEQTTGSTIGSDLLIKLPFVIDT